MDVNKTKDIVKAIMDLLNNKNLPQEKAIFDRVEYIFGPFSEEISKEKIWLTLHSLISNIFKYEKHYLSSKQGFKFKLMANRYCRLEQCPLQEINIENSEPDIINLVIGPMGHLKDGDAEDFIELILNRLSINGKVTEAYYFDPYIQEPFHASFSEMFLVKLKEKIQPLIAVTTKTISTNNSSVEIKKIPKDQIHDRFVIILEDDKWKGVSIGGSLNGFPNKLNGASQDKKHFIITKLEDDDANLLSNVLKNNF